MSAFRDGYRCTACGWTGPFDDAAEWRGEPMCPVRTCTSLDLDPICLCVTCKDNEQIHGDQCQECHVHKFEDGTCGCGAEEVVRRDQVEPVRSLVKEVA